jgi:hypothetical protein
MKGALLKRATTGIQILLTVLAVSGTGKLNAALPHAPAEPANAPALKLMGNRFLTFNTVVRVRQIEVTRYDLPTTEPADPEPGEQSRNWSLMNRINQKGTRPQDHPVPLSDLTSQEQSLIRRHYPELFTSGANAN